MKSSMKWHLGKPYGILQKSKYREKQNKKQTKKQNKNTKKQQQNKQKQKIQNENKPHKMAMVSIVSK